MAATADTPAGDWQADALKKLYPEKYYASFLAQNTRPDGRSLGRARAATVGLGVVSSADSSALIRIGKTTVIAGIKLEVMVPPEDRPAEGCLQVSVELTTLCCRDLLFGRSSDLPSRLTQQLDAALNAAKVWHPESLCIQEGAAAWAAYLDVYVLADDGALLDACLLASAAALSVLRLPSVTVSAQGNVLPAEDASMEGAASSPALTNITKAATPLCLTCAIIQERLVADPSGDEVGLASTLVSATVDGQGNLIGLQHAGGGVELSDKQMQQCIAAARDRHTELFEVLTVAAQSF